MLPRFEGDSDDDGEAEWLVRVGTIVAVGISGRDSVGLLVRELLFEIVGCTVFVGVMVADAERTSESEPRDTLSESDCVGDGVRRIVSVALG